MGSSIFIVKNGRAPGKLQNDGRGEKDSTSKEYSVHNSNSLISNPGMCKFPALALMISWIGDIFHFLFFWQVEIRDTFPISNIHLFNRSFTNQINNVPEVRISYRPDLPFCFVEFCQIIEPSQGRSGLSWSGSASQVNSQVKGWIGKRWVYHHQLSS